MKNFFKIKYLAISLIALMPLATSAADSAPGATAKPDGKGPTAEERKARMEQCKADPAKCRAERQVKQEQWCKDNPARCKEMQERREKRMADCKANPDKCRTDKKARRDEMCKDNPERCKDMKEKMDQRRADKQVRFEQRFQRADVNGDGLISRAEAEKAMPHLLAHFDRIDANKDGQISKDEITALRKARFERRRSRAEPTKI